MNFWKQKTIQHWFVVVGVAILVFLLIALAQLISKRRNIENTILSLKTEIAELEEKNQRLADLIEFFNTETFVESQAREKFNLVKPDEQVVVIKESSESRAALTANNATAWFIVSNPKKWWNYFVKL